MPIFYSLIEKQSHIRDKSIAVQNFFGLRIAKAHKIMTGGVFFFNLFPSYIFNPSYLTSSSKSLMIISSTSLRMKRKIIGKHSAPHRQLYIGEESRPNWRNDVVVLKVNQREFLECKWIRSHSCIFYRVIRIMLKISHLISEEINDARKRYNVLSGKAVLHFANLFAYS